MSDSFRWAKLLLRAAGESEWRAVDSIVPVNFRSELKGIGAGTLRKLTSRSFEERDYTTQFRDVIIYDGRGVDSSAITSPEAALGNIIWRGFVRNQTIDIHEGVDDATGTISVDEYGIGLARQPLNYSQTYPDFNPYYDGIQYGNYDAGNFRTTDFIKRDENGDWKFPADSDSSLESQEYLWNRKRIIEWLVDQEPLIGDISFPWEQAESEIEQTYLKNKQDLLDNPAFSEEQIGPGGIPFTTLNAEGEERDRLNRNKADEDIANLYESYKWFFDYDLTPISNYEGESILTALDELLPEACSYYFDYNISLSAPDLIIINKSSVDLPEIVPRRTGIDIIVPPRTETFNITFSPYEIYDMVVVRGAPILWAGTVSLWDVMSDATLEKAWTPDEEIQWINGYPDVPGGFDLSNEQSNEITRKVLDNVFQKFNWVGSERMPQIGARSGNFGLNESSPIIPKKAFFGTYFGIDLSDSGDKAVLLKDHYIDTSLSNHKTPNKLALQWEDFLPFTRFDENFAEQNQNSLQYNLERDKWATPFIISPTINVVGPNPGEFWVDRSLSFGSASSCEIGFHPEGIWVRREAPQTDLHDIPEMWWLQDGGPERSVVSSEISLDTITNLPLNPIAGTEEESYTGKSHWARMLITISGRSSERLEAYARRKVNGVAVPIERVKVIDVDDCEIWCVHSNTVRGIAGFKHNYPVTAAEGASSGGENARDTIKNTIIRFPFEANYNQEINKTGVTVTRDDRKKLLRYLTSYFNLLTIQRTQMNLVCDLETRYTLKIGDMIRNVRDNDGIVYVNTTISSIQYVFEGGQPRISYQTSSPEASFITKSIHEAEEAKGLRPRIKEETRTPRIIK